MTFAQFKDKLDLIAYGGLNVENSMRLINEIVDHVAALENRAIDAEAKVDQLQDKASLAEYHGH